MDVLQCIGVGLLVLFIIRLLIHSNKIYHYTLIVLTLFVLVISPFFWKIEFTNYFHPIIANYFNRLNGSLFPIFPWINFILIGAIFAKYFLDAADKEKEEKLIRGTAIAGIAMLLSGHLFYSGLFPDYLTSIIPNPIFFMERLGYVIVFATLCWYYNRWRSVKKSFVLDASRESLLIYWLHLTVIYSMIWRKKSLASLIGPTLNLIESIAATLILMVTMVLIAKIWGWTKIKSPKYAGKVAWAIVGLLFIKFLLS